MSLASALSNCKSCHSKAAHLHEQAVQSIAIVTIQKAMPATFLHDLGSLRKLLQTKQQILKKPNNQCCKTMPYKYEQQHNRDQTNMPIQ